MERGVYDLSDAASEVFARNALSLLGWGNLNLRRKIRCRLARLRVTFTVLVSGGDEFNGWKQTRTKGERRR